MSELVKYEAAKYALAEAKAVDEVKHIHDVSAAMKAYAKQAKDKQMEVDACEIRIRAERRLGEMIRHQKETVGLNTGAMGIGKSAVGSDDRTPTLADVGISKDLSSRSQQIASIPEDEFEETLAEHREQQQAVTARTMEKLTDKGKEVLHTETHDVSDAKQFASIAISQLERIREDDPYRLRELLNVIKWCQQEIDTIEIGVGD
jgi:hypothetical protein